MLKSIDASFLYSGVWAASDHVYESDFISVGPLACESRKRSFHIYIVDQMTSGHWQLEGMLFHHICIVAALSLANEYIVAATTTGGI